MTSSHSAPVRPLDMIRPFGHHADMKNVLTRGTLAAAALAAASLFAAQAVAGELSLVLDDAPSIFYANTDITLSLHVSNRGAAASEVALACSLRGSDGEELWSRSLTGSAPAGGLWRTEITCRAGRAARKAEGLKIVLAKGDAPADELFVRIAGPGAKLPNLRVDGSHFVYAGGTRVLFRIGRRLRPPSTRWLFVRWAGSKFTHNVITAPDVLFIGDELMPQRGTAQGYLDRLSAKVPGLRAVSVPAGGAAAPSSLRAVARVFDPKLKPAKMAAIFIGNHDCDCGADAMDYRRALELIIQRLEGLGVKHFAVIPPIAPPHWRPQLERHRSAAAKVVWHYTAATIKLGGLLKDEVWLQYEEPVRTFLRDPSPNGHRILADTVADQLSRIRRP